MELSGSFPANEKEIVLLLWSYLRTYYDNVTLNLTWKLCVSASCVTEAYMIAG